MGVCNFRKSGKELSVILNHILFYEVILSYAWTLKICYCLHFAMTQCSITATFTEHLGDKHKIMQLEHVEYIKVMPLFLKSLCISLDFNNVEIH